VNAQVSGASSRFYGHFGGEPAVSEFGIDVLAEDRTGASIALWGNLGAAESALLRSILLPRAAQGRHLTVDLTGVTAAHQVALRALVAARRLATTRGGSVTLVGVPPGLSVLRALTSVAPAPRRPSGERPKRGGKGRGAFGRRA
jgi:anti-anti-sigma regulatory factor